MLPEGIIKMKSLKYNSSWDICLENVGELQIKTPNDVIVGIKYCGICGTDIGIATGEYPVAISGVTLGHEATGVVLNIGAEVLNVRVGDKVVINPTPYCGQCRMCQTLRINHCENKFRSEGGVSYDGAFSEQFLTTSHYVHKLKEETDLKAATFTEPLSCALAGIKKVQGMTTTVNSFVFGAGPMGLLYTWLLALRGYCPIVIEQSKQRYDFAKERLPRNASIYLSLEEALAQNYTDIEKPLDLIIDTTSGVLVDIYSMIACGATYLSIGLKKKEFVINSMDLADKSLSIVGSIDSLHGTFTEALNLIQGNIIPVGSFISHTFDLIEYESAFSMLGCSLSSKKLSAVKNECGKILLKI